MRQVERHQRREPAAPIGDVFERLRVGGFIRVEYIHIGTNGACIGDRLPDLQPDGRCSIVQRGNLQCIMKFPRDNPRPLENIVSRRGV